MALTAFSSNTLRLVSRFAGETEIRVPIRGSNDFVPRSARQRRIGFLKIPVPVLSVATRRTEEQTRQPRNAIASVRLGSQPFHVRSQRKASSSQSLSLPPIDRSWLESAAKRAVAEKPAGSSREITVAATHGPFGFGRRSLGSVRRFLVVSHANQHDRGQPPVPSRRRDAQLVGSQLDRSERCREVS